MTGDPLEAEVREHRREDRQRILDLLEANADGEGFLSVEVADILGIERFRTKRMLEYLRAKKQVERTRALDAAGQPYLYSYVGERR